MYSFLIADDEKAIRESIPKIIDFEKYGFSLCATAKDGEEALSKTLELRPDLVLLDIRMPGLDGIGYMEQLRKHHFDDTKVIILSGYSDFEYAQKALRFGARGYFTKPLEEDDFIETLMAIKSELDERSIFEKKSSIQTVSAQLKQMYHDGNGEREGYGDYCFLHFVILKNEYQGNLFSFLEESLREVLEEDVEFFQCKGGVYSYLCQKEIIETNGMVDITLLSHVIRRIGAQGIECAVLVDSNLFMQTCNTFRVDYDTHLYSMFTSYYWKRGKDVSVYPSHAKSEQTEDWQYVQDYVQKLREAIEHEDEDVALKYLRTIFGEAYEKGMDFTFMVDLYYRIYYSLREIVKDEDKDEISIKPIRWQETNVFLTYADVEKHCRDGIISLSEYVSNRKNKKGLSVGERAIQYLKKNYTSQIMLKDVADALYVNPAYLGRCIQKETGQSFNSILARLRMERAKELLRSTDMMIYEIAQTVGYQESKHFVAKFTALEGMAPLTYRKQNRQV